MFVKLRAVQIREKVMIDPKLGVVCVTLKDNLVDTLVLSEVND